MSKQVELRDCLISTLSPFFPDSDRVVGKPTSAADAIIAMLSCRSFSLECEPSVLRAKIRKIAGDFHPDHDADAMLALSEMRMALLEALEETKSDPAFRKGP